MQNNLPFISNVPSVEKYCIVHMPYMYNYRSRYNELWIYRTYSSPFNCDISNFTAFNLHLQCWKFWNPKQFLTKYTCFFADFLAELYDSYYAYSACLMPPNMCVEAYTTTMSEGKHNMMPYDDSLPYGSSFHRQLVMSSPLPREHPSRSPSVSSDGGKVSCPPLCLLFRSYPSFVALECTLQYNKDYIHQAGWVIVLVSHHDSR